MTDLAKLIGKGSVGATVGAVSGLDEERRRQLGADLLAYVRAHRDEWWWGNQAAALAVVAVGCLPTAAKTAELLGRQSVDLDESAAVPVIEVARKREITWLPDLAYRLAARLPRDNPFEGWGFIAQLLRHEKAPPPTGDRFVEGWVTSMAWPPEHRRNVPLADRIRADPFLVALVPRLFDIDNLGNRMVFEDKHALPRALAQLAAEGRLDRTLLLDGCVGRLLRGDRPGALRPFTALHGLLEPTPAEVAGRSGDYLRLLADAPAPVASLAQKTLRGLDCVELDAVLDASQAVLTRPDKALVRAQLSWLDQLARQQRDHAAEIAAVLAAAADHPAVDLRERASALAAKHGHTPVPAVTVVTGGDDLPPPPVPAPAPPPITDPDELAEEVAVLYSTRMTALPLERVLDGVVRLAGVDQPRLCRALMPVLERHRAGMGEHSWDPCCLCGLLTGVLHAGSSLVEAGARRGRWAALLSAFRRPSAPGQQPPVPRVPPPHRLLRARLAEIGAHVGPSENPGLLAAPTSATGAIDPVVLYERLAALGDRQPWQWDLTQALLRLPAGHDDQLAARAEALRTPAGDRLAAWLRAGGLPSPTFRAVAVPRRPRRLGYDPDYDRLPTHRVHVEVRPPDGVDDPLGLLTVAAAPIETGYGSWAMLWPAVLPGYRGLVAAHALPDVAGAADAGLRDGTAVLPLLAESTGEGSIALDVALAYGLGARHDGDRIAALDALLMLASAGDLNAAAVGWHVGALGANGLLTLPRVINPLRDAVAAGARLTTWRLLAAALPALLAQPTPPRGIPDLLTLAAETATATGVRIEVPGLSDVAARGGSSRLVVEARRLAKALGQ